MRIRLFGAVLVAGLVVAPPLYAADVRVKSVRDNRASDSYPFAGLEVELAVDEELLEDARGARTTIASAVDDSDRNLIPKDAERKDFESLDGGGQGKFTVKLRNPRRRAKTIRTLEGKIEIFVPKKDPAARVEVPLGGSPEKKIDGLAKQNVTLTVLTAAQYEAEKKKVEAEAKKNEAQDLGSAMAQMFGGLFSGFTEVSEKAIVLRLTDPDGKVVGFDVETKDGAKLDSRGGWSSGDPKHGQTKSMEFADAVPESARLVVHLLTAKSLVEVPIALKDVELP